MSDFDKEAERERLREKYGDDEAERESTQRMSELLLKGATMTNKHCGRCGDPIFRHDGQEFCPSCQSDGQQATGDATAADANSQDAAERGDNDTTPTAGGEGAPQQRDTAPQTQPGPREPQTRQSQNATPQQPQTTPPSAGESATPPAQPRVDPASVDADAVAQVEATIERFAAAAASTDDPERARECLSVVREAAETLRVLRAN